MNLLYACNVYPAFHIAFHTGFNDKEIHCWMGCLIAGATNAYPKQFEQLNYLFVNNQQINAIHCMTATAFHMSVIFAVISWTAQPQIIDIPVTEQPTHHHHLHNIHSMLPSSMITKATLPSPYYRYTLDRTTRQYRELRLRTRTQNATCRNETARESEYYATLVVWWDNHKVTVHFCVVFK